MAGEKKETSEQESKNGLIALNARKQHKKRTLDFLATILDGDGDIKRDGLVIHVDGTDVGDILVVVGVGGLGVGLGVLTTLDLDEIGVSLGKLLGCCL